MLAEILVHVRSSQWRLNGRSTVLRGTQGPDPPFTDIHRCFKVRHLRWWLIISGVLIQSFISISFWSYTTHIVENGRANQNFVRTRFRGRGEAKGFFPWRCSLLTAIDIQSGCFQNVKFLSIQVGAVLGGRAGYVGRRAYASAELPFVYITSPGFDD
jgi:hypothetical protein